MASQENGASSAAAAAVVPVDHKQVVKACKALKAHLERTAEASHVLAEERAVYLQFSLKLSPTPQNRPHVIPLKHSLYSPETSALCFFCKDPQEHYEEIISKAGFKNITVISVKKLKSHFNTHEARRRLLQQYDFFMADDRIMELMPRLLGSKFHERKKHPSPVRLARRNPATALNKVIAASELYIKGTCCAVKIGHTGFTWKQMAENFLVALAAVSNAVPRKASNILALHLRADNSAALPIWHAAFSPEDFPGQEESNVSSGVALESNPSTSPDGAQALSGHEPVDVLMASGKAAGPHSPKAKGKAARNAKRAASELEAAPAPTRSLPAKASKSDSIATPTAKASVPTAEAASTSAHSTARKAKAKGQTALAEVTEEASAAKGKANGKPAQSAAKPAKASKADQPKAAAKATVKATPKAAAKSAPAPAPAQPNPKRRKPTAKAS